MATQDELPFESDAKLAELLRDGAKRDVLPPASSQLRSLVMDKLQSDGKHQASDKPDKVNTRSGNAGAGAWLGAIVTIAGCVVVAVLVGQFAGPRQNKEAVAKNFGNSDPLGTSNKESGYLPMNPAPGKGRPQHGPFPVDESEAMPVQLGDGEDYVESLNKTRPEGRIAQQANEPYSLGDGTNTSEYAPLHDIELAPGTVAGVKVKQQADGYLANGTNGHRNVGSVTGKGVTGRGQPYARSDKSPTRGITPAEGIVAEVDKLAILEDRFGETDGKNTWEFRVADSSHKRMSDMRWHESQQRTQFGREQYAKLIENQPVSPYAAPLSTFGIDVDTASYANIRRFLTAGSLPPVDAIRIEEMVNYFSYSYPKPEGDDPFRVDMELAECPWNQGHLLLRIGLKGKEVEISKRPASNLVFLVDVSGSMADENKLPLLRQSLSLLTEQLTENDRVSIVTYAGETSLRLPATSGDQKEKIQTVINGLSSGGSTNGGAGIILAYEQAAQGFIKDGINRVILATDGDLNVGITSDEDLVKLIEEKRQGGTFLTVLGFGEGNLQDAKMEGLADHGNGVYAYIDGLREARKVLVEQFSGTLQTIAKDVKIQVEFNPQEIENYRLIGYENRALAAKDFANDKKDAGDIGAGHTVTALYELVPVSANKEEDHHRKPMEEPLKYQNRSANTVAPKEPAPEKVPAELSDAAKSGELLTVKLRFKKPAADVSELREFALKDKPKKFGQASPDFQFASSVAGYGMLLRSSPYRGSLTAGFVAEVAAANQGSDQGGYRAEFVDLVRKSVSLLPAAASERPSE
ncbi:MAG: vWA domain-containing protein [Planctomycetaceae bacterium]